jgi:hypothetical protein
VPPLLPLPLLLSRSRGRYCGCPQFRDWTANRLGYRAAFGDNVDARGGQVRELWDDRVSTLRTTMRILQTVALALGGFGIVAFWDSFHRPECAVDALLMLGTATAITVGLPKRDAAAQRRRVIVSGPQPVRSRPRDCVGFSEPWASVHRCRSVKNSDRRPRTNAPLTGRRARAGMMAAMGG